MSGNVVPLPGRQPPSPILKVTPCRFVTIELAEAVTGLTASAIRTKIGKGVWVEGRQYKRAPDGRVFVDLRGFEAWVAQEAE
ncbi:MAG TPA: excisionase family protein [Solimonas sp.]